MPYRADEGSWELNTPQGVQAAVLDYKREYDERVRDSIPVDSIIHSCINAMVTYTAPGVSDRDKRSALTKILSLELLHPGRMERLLNAFKILCTPPLSPRANHGGEPGLIAEEHGPDPLAENHEDGLDDEGEQHGPDPLAEDHEAEPEPILPAAVAAPVVAASRNVGFFRPETFNPIAFRYSIQEAKTFRTEIVGYHAEYVAKQADLLAKPITTKEEKKQVDNITHVIKALDFLIQCSKEGYDPTENDCKKLENMLQTMEKSGAGRLQIFAQACQKLFLDNEPKTEPKGEFPK